MQSTVVAHIFLSLAALAHQGAAGSGGAWDRIGPWNIFDDKDLKGESGTLACAASPETSPDVIYAGGQNNGASSGVIKTIDGGKHWMRKSNGLWDTRVLGVWVHPDDPQGNHVFVGTHSGIYESTDGAETWSLREETANFGNVMSFREGLIQGQPYILANSQDGILTMPKRGGKWSKIPAPGGIAPNAHLSVVTHNSTTEVLTCIGGWGGGQLYYASLDTPTNGTWTGPITTKPHTYTSWELFPGQSQIWGKCKTATDCDPDVHDLGVFDNLTACQAAVNATTAFKVASYTYQHKIPALGDFAGHCYAMSSLSFSPTPQANVDSGRAPGVFPGEVINCANAAVDPKDRNHFLYSKGGQYRCWESHDGGETVREFTNHDTGVYFVMIDQEGWYYTATQAGAFVSSDAGASWDPYHVIMHSRSGRTIDRVPHDYQRIVPEFRGTGVAFPSDQGLHIVNRSSFNLISAVGDMKNTISLSALLSPNPAGDRNLIVNMWDWDVAASWDDGKTWAGWKPTEKSPGNCGEGGGGTAMGKSSKLVMFHRNSYWSSVDGGHNFFEGHFPGTAGAFDYVRQTGSRTEPAGTCFALMDAPPTGSMHHRHPDDAPLDLVEVSESGSDDGGGLEYRPDDADEDDRDRDDDIEEMNPNKIGYVYNPGIPEALQGTKKFFMISHDFGGNWTWAPMPDDLQAGGLAVDPTSQNSLFAFTSNCLAHSNDNGKTWSSCSASKGLTGSFSKLLIKDSTTMFMLRNGAVPLRTQDGGATWVELSSAAPLFKFGATMDGSLSWSGNTLVLSGVDLGAIGRKQYGTSVWKSTSMGEQWTDETGDLVTISPGHGVWYDDDFYLVTAGEGVMVKRDFDVKTSSPQETTTRPSSTVLAIIGGSGILVFVAVFLWGLKTRTQARKEGQGTFVHTAGKSLLSPGVQQM